MLFFVAFASYFVQMIIIPKGISMGIVLFVGLILAVNIWHKERTKGSFFYPPFLKKLFPFYAWVFLSSLWSINSAEYVSFAFLRSLLTFEFGIAIGFFCKDEFHFYSVLKGFVWGGFFSSVVVLALQHQYIGMMRLGNFIYGSAMEFSGGLVISIISSLILFIQNREKKYLAISTCFFAMCALSGSRSALVLPIVFFAIFYALYKQKIKKILGIMIALIVSFFGVYTLSQKIPALYDVVGYRIEQLVEDKSEDGSFKERSIMKDTAFEVWLEHPIVGAGLYGFGKALENKYGRNVYSHCDYAEILSCFGLIGAFLFYVPLLYVVCKRRNISLAYNNTCISALLAFALLLFARMGSSIFFMNIKDMMMISLIMSFLSSLHKKRGIVLCQK